MKNMTWNLSGALLGAAAGALAILFVAGSTPASAQAPDAAERCTPDVMRLCSEFVPDEDTELYFKAADVVVLPYTEIFQSGVLVLGYSFGLPVIATDVGSLKDDIVEGRTGWVCRPCDPVDLAAAIERYFASQSFQSLGQARQEIRAFAKARFSWDAVSRKTLAVYEALLEPQLVPARNDNAE